VVCPPPQGSPVAIAGTMAKAWSRPASAKTNDTRNHSAATWHGSSVSVNAINYGFNFVLTLLLGTNGVW